MFGDIGEGEINESGECIIMIDDVFVETIAPDIEYQVFIQKEGKGDIWVERKVQNAFMVKGTPGLRFAWEIKSKQWDSQWERLEAHGDEEEPKIDYESQYINEIEEIIEKQEEILYVRA